MPVRLPEKMHTHLTAAAGYGYVKKNHPVTLFSHVLLGNTYKLIKIKSQASGVFSGRGLPGVKRNKYFSSNLKHILPQYNNKRIN
jgi:hypothetical protein